MDLLINKKLKGFTLSELLVVLVIIGILILLSLPSLMPLISRTRSLEAKKGLQYLHTLQKTYYYEYSRFSENLEFLGFEQENLITDNEYPGKANYLIEIIEATQSTYVARATAVIDFNGDNNYNIWEIDQSGNLVELSKD